METFLKKYGGRIILISAAIVLILCLIYFIVNTDAAAVKESVFLISLAGFLLMFGGIYFAFWVQNKLRTALKTNKRIKSMQEIVYTVFMWLSFLLAVFIIILFLIAPEGFLLIAVSCLLGLSCAIIYSKMKQSP